MPSNAPFIGPPSARHRKTDAIKRLLPSWYNHVSGTALGALLLALGESDHALAGEGAGTALTAARDSLFLNTATDTDLSILGQNYGASRPFALSQTDDVKFRTLIPLLAWEPKSVLRIMYKLTEAVLGTKESGAKWAIYEVGSNQIILEADLTNLVGGASTAPSATYLHADASVSGPSTYMGDYFTADASVAGTTVGSNTVLINGGLAQDLLATVFAPVLAAGVRLVIEPYTS
jgi:hypothetical protein